MRHFIVFLLLLSAPVHIFADEISVETSVNSTRTPNTMTSERVLARVNYFFKNTVNWRYAEALNTYRTLLAQAQRPDILTWEYFLPQDIKTQIIDTLKKMQDEKDVQKLSELCITLWDLYYKAGSYLYFKDAESFKVMLAYQYLSAIEAYDYSIKLHNTPLAHRQKAIVIMDIGGSNQLAVRELQSALRLDKQDALTLYKLWNAYRESKLYQLAIGSYQKALKIDPTNELSYLNLTITYWNTKDTKKEEAGYETYLKTCTKYCHIAYYNQWLTKKRGGQISDAIELFDKAIDFTKKTYWTPYRNAYATKAEALMVVWKYQEALDNLLVALPDPKEEIVYTMNNGNYNTDLSDTYLMLAESYLELGNTDKATEYFKLAQKQGLDKAHKAYSDQIDQKMIKKTGKSFIS